MCLSIEFLKFLREGKILVDDYKVNCKYISLLTVQIYHVVSNREAIYMFIHLPITTMFWASYYSCLGTGKLSCYNYFGFLLVKFYQDRSHSVDFNFISIRLRNQIYKPQCLTRKHLYQVCHTSPNDDFEQVDPTVLLYGS